LRPSGVYGLHHQPPQSKWYALIRQAAAGDFSGVTARGGKEVHAADVATAVAVLLQADRIAGQCYNCCDSYVCEEQVAAIAARQAGLGYNATRRNPGPRHHIDTSKIRSLGMTFGGSALLEKTIQQIRDYACAVPRNPSGQPPGHPIWIPRRCEAGSRAIRAAQRRRPPIKRLGAPAGGARADSQQVVPRVQAGVVAVGPHDLEGIVADQRQVLETDALGDRGGVERALAGALVDAASTAAVAPQVLERKLGDMNGGPAQDELAVRNPGGDVQGRRGHR
jgi:hypothetical protein